MTYGSNVVLKCGGVVDDPDMSLFSVFSMISAPKYLRDHPPKLTASGNVLRVNWTESFQINGEVVQFVLYVDQKADYFGYQTVEDVLRTSQYRGTYFILDKTLVCLALSCLLCHLSANWCNLVHKTMVVGEKRCREEVWGGSGGRQDPPALPPKLPCGTYFPLLVVITVFRAKTKKLLCEGGT